jgi:hypothetical protein
MALSAMKKMQDTTSIDPRVDAILKARKLKDTTKAYDREETLENINKITRGELKPKSTTAPKQTQGKMTYAVIDRKGDTLQMSKAEFEKRYKK